MPRSVRLLSSGTEALLRKTESRCQFAMVYAAALPIEVDLSMAWL